MTYSLRITEFTAARPQDRGTLELLVQVGQEALKRSPQCLGCQTYRDAEDPTKLVSIESWTDQSARDAAAMQIPAEVVRGATAIMTSPPASRTLSGPNPWLDAIPAQTDVPIRVALIIASVREGRLGPVVAGWFSSIISKDRRFEVEIIDLATIDLPPVLPADPNDLVNQDKRPRELQATSASLRNVDAFVMVTPEYNHGMPASLKHFIDWHLVEWQHKPVAAIGYGGFGGGLRAIEGLRLVMAELHATVIRDTVTFNAPWDLFTELGALRNPDGPVRAAELVCDSLFWWASALKRGRADRPSHEKPESPCWHDQTVPLRVEKNRPLSVCASAAWLVRRSCLYGYLYALHPLLATFGCRTPRMP